MDLFSKLNTQSEKGYWLKQECRHNTLVSYSSRCVRIYFPMLWKKRKKNHKATPVWIEVFTCRIFFSFQNNCSWVFQETYKISEKKFLKMHLYPWGRMWLLLLSWYYTGINEAETELLLSSGIFFWGFFIKKKLHNDRLIPSAHLSRLKYSTILV